MPIENALTIDLEDWYHVCGVPDLPEIPADRRRVRPATELVLELLREHQVQATFFVLGGVAQEEPDLVPMILREGHEVASHGWSHRMVTGLSPDEFREELRATAAVIRDQGGPAPGGFRAPQWSLSQRATPWAFTILKEEGYRYDSSLNPLPFVGESRGSRIPFAVETARGPLPEFPPLVLPSPCGNLPVGGGWGFRFFPFSFVRKAIRQLNDAGAPAVLFLHPRELDPAGPRLTLPPLKRFAAYGGTSDARPRLGRLLTEFRFGRLDRVVDQWHSA